MATIDYNQIALLYAEKYGIFEWNITGNIMTYTEEFTNSKYNAIVNLDTLTETRTKI